MNRKDIRTGKIPVACDVCGRTMLSGEVADVYLAGGQRRNVCELCSVRAAHQGWIREAAHVDLPPSRSGAERRPLLERLRGRRDRRGPEEPDGADLEPGAAEFYVTGATEAEPYAEPPPAAPAEPDVPSAPDAYEVYDPATEPRHVHAVPASGEMKAHEALELFNGSEHRKTVAGVARSLGVPTVFVASDPVRGSVVRIVVSWELCWYRYEVDLADGDGHSGVRLIGQGYELSELDSSEQAANAAADDSGALALAG
jgi:hypothetical protein